MDSRESHSSKFIPIHTGSHATHMSLHLSTMKWYSVMARDGAPSSSSLEDAAPPPPAAAGDLGEVNEGEVVLEEGEGERRRAELPRRAPGNGRLQVPHKPASGPA